VGVGRGCAPGPCQVVVQSNRARCAQCAPLGSTSPPPCRRQTALFPGCAVPPAVPAAPRGTHRLFDGPRVVLRQLDLLQVHLEVGAGARQGRGIKRERCSTRNGVDLRARVARGAGEQRERGCPGRAPWHSREGPLGDAGRGGRSLPCAPLAAAARARHRDRLLAQLLHGHHIDVSEHLCRGEGGRRCRACGGALAAAQGLSGHRLGPATRRARWLVQGAAEGRGAGARRAGPCCCMRPAPSTERPLHLQRRSHTHRAQRGRRTRWICGRRRGPLLCEAWRLVHLTGAPCIWHPRHRPHAHPERHRLNAEKATAATAAAPRASSGSDGVVEGFEPDGMRLVSTAITGCCENSCKPADANSLCRWLARGRAAVMATLRLQIMPRRSVWRARGPAEALRMDLAGLGGGWDAEREAPCA
jgi:hypothetical protein